MLSHLFAGDFDAYFAEAGQGAPLWLFVHVPKTAGSSLQAEMAAIHKPAANIEIDYTDANKPYQLQFDEAVDRFIARHRAIGYRFATGHVRERHTALLRQEIPALRCFTMLRNPIARIVSDYRYQRSPMNVARADFIARTPDFAAYVARPFVHNKTAHALVPKPILESGDSAAAVDFVMRHFAFVGIQEMYPLALRTLTTLMGHPRNPEARVRVNPPGAENELVLSAADEAELRRLNALDIALVHAFTLKWRAVRDDLRAYLAASRPRLART